MELNVDVSGGRRDQQSGVPSAVIPLSKGSAGRSCTAICDYLRHGLEISWALVAVEAHWRREIKIAQFH